MPDVPTGDLNCDGVTDESDIQPFVLALINPASYCVVFPNCNRIIADFNGDGIVNGADIAGFLDCLLLGVCP